MTVNKKSVLSAFVITLCFLVGYTAVQTTWLVRDWIFDSLSACKVTENGRCIDEQSRRASSEDRP